jgi:uncharacterized protein
MRKHIVLTVCIFGYFSLMLRAADAADLEKLRSQAEAGDAKAQFELGRAYQEGTGVQQNDELAVEWYRKSADHDYAKAQNSLGVMYARGLGVNQDKAEAFRWYKKAAKQGLPEACFNVAISYYNGDGVAEDMSLAYAWMLLAKDSGDVQTDDALKRIADELPGRVDGGKLKLAALYEKGDETPRNLPRALDLYFEIAKTESPETLFAGIAQYRLCQFYAAGQGVSQDFTEAKSWCKKAAVNGMAGAYVVLGRMAEQGLGGNKDLAEASDWYQHAALARLPDGFIGSGRVKLQSGSHDDQKRAYFWFYLAQRFKIAEADTLLQQAAAQLNDKEIAQEQKRAKEWLKTPESKKKKQLKEH